MQAEDFDLIEKYHLGELDKAGQEAVEKKMQADTEFAEQVQLRQSMDNLLRFEKQKTTIKGDLEKFGDQYFTESTEEIPVVPIKKNRQWWAIAAGLLFLIAATIWILQPEENLYQQFAQHEPLSLTERNDGQNQLKLEAQNAFNQQAFDIAYPKLEQLVNENPDDVQLQLAKGIAALEIGKEEVARFIFLDLYYGCLLYTSPSPRD